MNKRMVADDDIQNNCMILYDFTYLLIKWLNLLYN